MQRQVATFDDTTDPQEAHPFSKDTLTVDANSVVTSGEAENAQEPWQWQRSKSGRLELFSSMGYDKTSASQQETVVGQRKHRRYTKKDERPLYPPEILNMLKESPDEDESSPHSALESPHLERSMLEALRLQLRMLNVPTYSEGSAKYAKNPLLTKKQEYFLGTIVQRAVPLMKLRNSFLEETGTMPTVETIAKLAERDLDEVRELLDKGEEAKKLMIQYNIGLIYYTARLYKGPFARKHRGDLIIEGMGPKGLPRAVMGFDPTLGHRFASYAFPFLRQVMSHSLARESTAFVLTPYLKYTISKISRAMETLSLYDPSTDEEFEALAKEANMSVKKVRKHSRLMKRTLPALSLERSRLRYQRDGGVSDALVDRLEDEKSDPNEFLRQQRLREYLDVALSLLDPQERQVLTLRYGLDKMHQRRPATLIAVGKVCGLTPERIRQIEEKAKRKIRHIWKKVVADEDLLQT